MTAERLASDGAVFGAKMPETFVGMEIRQIDGGRAQPIQFFHYRTKAGEEVDVAFEDCAGRLIGIEVKASATVTSSDFKGLLALAVSAVDHFVCGPCAF